MMALPDLPLVTLVDLHVTLVAQHLTLVDLHVTLVAHHLTLVDLLMTLVVHLSPLQSVSYSAVFHPRLNAYVYLCYQDKKQNLLYVTNRKKHKKLLIILALKQLQTLITFVFLPR